MSEQTKPKSKREKSPAATAAYQDGVWVQLATRIPKDLHRSLKLHCVQTDVSVMAFVVKAIETKLEREAAKVRRAA